MLEGFDLGKGEPQITQFSSLPELSVPQFEQARGALLSGRLVKRRGHISSPQTEHQRLSPGLFLPHFVQPTFGKVRPFYLKTAGALIRMPGLSHIIVINPK